MSRTVVYQTTSPLFLSRQHNDVVSRLKDMRIEAF